MSGDPFPGIPDRWFYGPLFHQAHYDPPLPLVARLGLVPKRVGDEWLFEWGDLRVFGTTVSDAATRFEDQFTFGINSEDM